MFLRGNLLNRVVVKTSWITICLSQFSRKYNFLSQFTRIRAKTHFSTALLMILSNSCFIKIVRKRSNQRRCSIKKSVLKNVIKFTEKHLRQSHFFNKTEGFTSATWLKKRLWHRCFAVNFVKFSRTPFFK